MKIFDLIENDEWKDQSIDSKFLYKKYLSACHRLGIELQKADHKQRTKSLTKPLNANWFDEPLAVFNGWKLKMNTLYPNRHVWLRSIRLTPFMKRDFPELQIQWDKVEQAWTRYLNAGGNFDQFIS